MKTIYTMKQQMKQGLFALLITLLCAYAAPAQVTISCKLLTQAGKPVAAASVWVSNRLSALSDENGEVTFSVKDSTTAFRITHTAYQPLVLSPRQLPANGEVFLQEAIASLKEVVVSTGYQTLPKERATGSFVKVDSATLNLQAGPNIINRLNGVTSGVLFDNNGSRPPLTIRGISSFTGPKQPLIVLDNFPFDGNVNNINPNDVESITVLKDAAAASVWGTRAGNGVIVITTKHGHKGKMYVNANVNITVQESPDLFYLRQMKSADFIDVETYLFDNKFYREQTPQKTALSPVVEWLIAKRDGVVPAAEADAAINRLRNVDVRNGFNSYMYQPAVNTQYSVNLGGGNDYNNYYLSAGYDGNRDNLAAAFQRFTLRMKDIYQPVKNLRITVALNWVNSRSRSGKPGWGDISPGGGRSLYPYAQLADEHGNALPVVKDYRTTFIDTAGDGRLLNWRYYPLTDYQNSRTGFRTADILANAGISYTIFNGFTAALEGSYQLTADDTKTLYNEDSYFTRDMVNRFTQIDYGSGNITYPVPKGSITDIADSRAVYKNLRAQLGFSRTWKHHAINSVAGWETRETKSESHGFRTYGYQDDILTFTPVDEKNAYRQFNSGFPAVIPSGRSFSETLNRFVSVYANAAYTYQSRYIFSGSMRKDASNLFGVERNKKGVPLWSAGAAWLLSDESFYHFSFLKTAKLRLTYGFSGTADPNRSAVATIAYIPYDWFTGLSFANIAQVANPELQWERTRIINAGFDFTLAGGWLGGSIEYYRKSGLDLFGPAPVDVTTGLQRPAVSKNIASMQGQGVDIDWTIKPLSKAVQWQVNLLFSYNLSKVKDYYLVNDIGSYYAGSPAITPVPGKPVYSLLSYRWGGLDPQTGDPIGYINGKQSTNWASITYDSTSIADLVYSGPSAPPVFGAITNSISWKGFTITANITYKLGYYFRKSSINYYSLYYGWNGHSDYEKRWQKPGDELNTSVPSMVYPANLARDNFYLYSEVLVRRADNIRLQFVNLEYQFSKAQWKKMPFAALRIYGIVNNAAILWKADHDGLDPDYPASLRPRASWTVGMGIGL